MHSARLELACPDAHTARSLAAALAVEGADGPDGAYTSFAADGLTLVASARAPTVATLRATVHTAVRLFDATLRALS